MAAQENPTQSTAGQGVVMPAEGSSVPPGMIPPSQPVQQPQPNMPPPMPAELETTNPQEQVVAPNPVGFVPPTVSPKGKGGMPKKLILILFFLLLLVGGIFAVVRFVLPGLNISTGSSEIVWWGLWEDETIITPIIEEYEAANPGVTIKYEKKAKEDYRERLAGALATDDAPDIFRIHNSWVPMFRRELAAAPADVMSSAEFQSTFYPVASDDLIGTEGPLALPLGFDGLAMFVNEEIFSTYGQTVPTDWNTLRDTARALTIKDERGVITQSGASIGTTANVDHWPEIIALLMLQNGANPNMPNDTAGRGAQVLQFYKRFVDDGIWDDTQPSSTIAFSTGRVAMYFGPSWRAFEILDRNPSLKFRVVPVPQIPQQGEAVENITYASYWAEGVNAKSDSKEAAWKFLAYLSQRENLTKLYENASRARLFGEPYPRADMRDLLLTDKIIGGFVELAPTAKSGYLYSRTFDGDSGINSSLSQYYEDTLSQIKASDDVRPNTMTTLSNGVRQVLSRYGLAAPLPTPTN